MQTYYISNPNNNSLLTLDETAFVELFGVKEIRAKAEKVYKGKLNITDCDIEEQEAIQNVVNKKIEVFGEYQNASIPGEELKGTLNDSSFICNTRKETKILIEDFIKLRGILPDEISIQVPHLYPQWQADVEYAAGDKILYEDILYKVLQPHTSQETWTPVNTPSLFTKMLIPDENIIYDWEQPDSTNPYMKDNKVKHDGKIWISTVDYNVWAPGYYGWEEIQ